MGRTHALLLALLVAWSTTSATGAAQTAERDPEREALGRQIEQRFDVLPVQGGVVLRPRGSRDFRSVDLTDGAIAVDGEPVTGAEVRRRLGADADLIIRLSYLSAADQRALFAPQSTVLPSPPAAPAAPSGPALPTPPPPREERRSRGGRSSDRVRIGGGVQVSAGEVVDGDVVAIGGSATVDGEVHGEVVAIGGSVTLGPQADVSGDVTVVGGPFHRDPASRVGGEIHEVGFGDVNFWPRWRRMWPPFRGDGAFFESAFGSVFALVSTVTRLGVLCVLASIVLLFGRGYVERVSVRAASEPMKAGIVGVLIQLLFFPLLLATIFVMVITIIGIPLLALIPFALLAFALLFLVGFTAVAYDLGRLAASRFGVDGQNPYLVAAMGIAVVLSPVLISRLVGLAGGVLWPLTFTLLLLGLLAEYVVWTVGLGAVALVKFDRKPAS